MEITSKTKKLLAGITTVGVLTLGGGTAAFAADTGTGSGTPTATAGRQHRGVLRVALRTAFDAAASTLNMTPQELRDAVKSGPQSIASVAGDQTDAVKSAIVTALSDKIDEAAANGNFPADRVDSAKARLPQLAERFVNRVPGQHQGAQ